MSATGNSRPGRASSKSGHDRYSAESGSNPPSVARRIQPGLDHPGYKTFQIFNLCVASSLWSSPIFCDSATKPS